MSHPYTGLVLVSDKHETMNLPKASSLWERLMQIFGAEFMEGLLEVHSKGEGIELSAIVSISSNFRNSRSHQYIFINKRPIKDTSVSHAAYKAYEGILPPDKHPVFFLFVELDPSRVDFNVHPTKREVRFEDKESVYRFINNSLRDKIKEDRTEYVRQFTEVLGGTGGPQNFPGYALPQSFSDSPFVAGEAELTYRTSLPFIYLGDTFVACSGTGGLTIIDHHAAHERVLYEKMLSGLQSITRPLLFPKQVRVSAKEHAALLENREMLGTLGFEIEDFGNSTVIVRTVPEELEESGLPGMLSDIASGFIEPNTSFQSLRESIAARIACHASIRGKKILSQEEFHRLIADLDKTEHPDQCPHGRPTRIFYSLNELNKLFKRK